MRQVMRSYKHTLFLESYFVLVSTKEFLQWYSGTDSMAVAPAAAIAKGTLPSLPPCEDLSRERPRPPGGFLELTC